MLPQPVDLARTLLARAHRVRTEHEARADVLRAELRSAAARLRGDGAISAAWLVGSLAWGGFGPRSDVDVVVRGASPSALGEIWACLVDVAARHVGENLDVLSFETLPAPFQGRVLSEGLRLDEP